MKTPEMAHAAGSKWERFPGLFAWGLSNYLKKNHYDLIANNYSSDGTSNLTPQ
jgi:hypothetical protein